MPFQTVLKADMCRRYHEEWSSFLFNAQKIGIVIIPKSGSSGDAYTMRQHMKL